MGTSAPSLDSVICEEPRVAGPHRASHTYTQLYSMVCILRIVAYMELIFRYFIYCEPSRRGYFRFTYLFRRERERERERDRERVL